MKRLLLYSFFLFPFFSEAQTSVYHPFPDSNAFWCEWAQGFNGMCYWENHHTMHFGYDTLINGNTYHSLIESGSSYNDSCLGGNTSYSQYRAFIRQDISQRKVFIYDWSTHHDTIFYDFNLQVGDTLNRRKVYWWSSSDIRIVSSIDSVLMDGQYRTRYNYSTTTSCTDTSIIEGIGSIAGLFGPTDCFEAFEYLELFSQNHIVLYPSSTDSPGNYQQCYDYTTGIFVLDGVSFSISPNPAHDVLNVECKMQNAELKIYDVMGRIEMEQQIRNQKSEIRINLPAGVYFVRIGNYTQKLVIE